jgi:hypothetical protein
MSYYATAPPDRVGDRLGTLRRTLDGLHDRLCQGVAQAVARAASGAVRDCLLAFLTGQGTAGHQTPRRFPSRPSSSWDDRWPPSQHDRDDRRYDSFRSSDWPEEGRDPWSADDYGQDETCDTPASSRASPEPSTQEKPPRRWVTALASAWQAARLWLRLRPGRYPLLSALVVGLAAGLGTLLCGPPAAAAVGVAGTALGLAALSAGARCVAEALAEC